MRVTEGLRMRSFKYESLPSRVVFGAGTFATVGDEVSRLGAQRVMVFAGRPERSLADRLKWQLGPRMVDLFDDVLPHVPLAIAASARARARDLQADLLLTVGGGSTTGLGKAVALESGAPILAIPTTYAGSEMTPIWGLTEAHRKTTGRDPRVLPRVVVYDPELTLTLPPGLSGASGMNAMAHCVEAAYAADCPPMIRIMAEEGIQALAVALPAVVDEPHDLAARSEAFYGAYLAGCAFAVAGSGLHHKICHVLGGAYNLPHAETHAIVLPHAVAYNAPAMAEAMRRIGDALGADEPALALYQLAGRLGIPSGLREIGMAEADLDAATELVLKAIPTNPRPLERGPIRRLLDDAEFGRRPVTHLTPAM
jgi:maleylacetate reductase